MEELLELRACIEMGRYAEALTLIGEMEEMSKDDLEAGSFPDRFSPIRKR